MAEKLTNSADRCPYCTFKGKWIMVHGHYQCTNCGWNVSECCSGETMENESGPTDKGHIESTE